MPETESKPPVPRPALARLPAFAAVAIFLLALVAGSALRLSPDLGERPMHTDEAILGIKFGELLETGKWKYDPNDYHGPALPYLTLPFAWATGADEITEVSEALLRTVPFAFCMGLMVLAVWLRKGLGGAAVAWSSLFLAVSPIFVYYSRYYIMELLLVFFSLGAIVSGWRYWVSRRGWWLAPAGFSLAMMHAAKETCVIHYFAMAGGVLACCAIGWLRPASGKIFSKRIAAHPLKAEHLKPLLVAASITWFLFYSSFFTNLPEGLVQSITTYEVYLGRAEGSLHDKPWYEYLHMLLWKRDHYLWTEAGLFLFALVGIGYAFIRKPAEDESTLLPRFLAVYAVLLGAVYSAIAYKTPWTILGFHHGIILMAGYGAACLFQGFRGTRMRLILTIALVSMCAHLGYQARRAVSTRLAADVRNPYILSHTSTAFMRLLQRLEELAEIKKSIEGAGSEEGWLKVNVIHSESAWPLPWYTRMHKTVGFPSNVPPTDVLQRMDVIIAEPTIGEMQLVDVLRARLENSHVIEGFHSLRPAKEMDEQPRLLTVFVRKELWNAFIEERSTRTPKP